MPSRNTTFSAASTKCSKKNSPKKTSKKKMGMEEKLSKTRSHLCISRKRVDVFKKTSYTERSKFTGKPADDSWITSGRIGSRDAVLVFRTSILNKNSQRLTHISDKMSTSSVAKSSHSNTRNSSESKFSSISSSLPSSNSYLHSSMHIFPKKDKFSTGLEHNSSKRSLPSIKMYSRHVPIVDEKPSKTYSPKICKKLQNNSKCHLNKSLSCSDNSISSDYEDLIESDDFGSIDDMQMERHYNINASIIPSKEIHRKSETNIDDEYNIEDEPYSQNMPALELKLTYKFMQTETKLLRKIFLRHGLKEVDSNENFSILWTGVHMKPDILRNLAPYQRVNHFPRSYELTRKDRMYKNIERMQHLRGMKHFDIVPQSFVLPLEYKDLLTAHNKCRGPWIVKPAASSRGRGIFIVNSPDQIPQDEQVLVSKYVAEPLCIDGHKCDLRVYVLVTSFDPLIIYLYKEGLVRLATVKYDRNADNLWNPCMHLCNYSINKYHSDYIKSNDVHDEDVGHKWTLSALLRHLKSQGCDTRQLMLNIEDLIIKSLLSCAQSIISACRMFVPNGNNCFELYGFDILIDDTLKPWLLEINLSPSMGVDSPLDTKVKACLITDLLTCVGIPAFTPAMRAHYDTKWTRFRNISCSRRTSSADPGGNPPGGAKRATNSNAAPLLTIEEQRIIRNARLQNARRGGFVRIFPTNDSLQRYGIFLDSTTGIPMSTSVVQGQQHFVSILTHNYNQMLYNNLYGKESQDNGTKEENSLDQRMLEYERALPADSPIVFRKKPIGPKCVEEGKRLRKQIHKLMDGGSELTILQARQAFAYYLEAVLRRLTQEPRDYHEKLILKFLNRVGSSIKAPVFFRNPQNLRIANKARSAMVAKLLCDFLEQYNRDTETYVDTFDHYGMIPSSLFNEFLSQAQESDLESVLTMNTSLTGTMPYLYNRFGLSVPPTPPIPSGLYGFLRALPSMVIGGSGSRDFNKCESYYRSSEKDIGNLKNEKLPDAVTKGRHFIRR